MIDIERQISPLIESQFPAFYREEGPRFIAFLKAYYEWMELEQYIVNGEDVAPKTLYYARSLFDIRDIDRTTSEFINHFKEKYLAGINLEQVTDTKNLTKHALEMYRSKGSQRSVELLFSLLYNEEVKIYLPGQDILRASDGVWYSPKYLELEPNDKTKTYIGKQITGASSGATALVEGFARRNVRGKIVDVLYISSLTGNFSTGELISTGIVEVDNPFVIGSLTNVDIVNPGRDFNVGDVVTAESEISGSQGKARVTEVGVSTGLVAFELIDGGTGYSTNADVIISEKVVLGGPMLYTDPYNTTYTQFEQVSQALANVIISSPQGTLLNSNNLVLGVNSTPAVVSAGYVYNGNVTATTKFLSIAVRDVANAAITSITNANTSGSFNAGESVYQLDPLTGANSFSGTVVHANSTYVLVHVVVGSVTNSVTLTGVSSNCQASVSSHTLINGSFANAANIVTAGNSAVGNCVISSFTNETATGLVVGSNNNAVGVYNVVNYFRAPDGFTKSYITNSDDSKIFPITSVSTGTPGSFEVGSIVDTELLSVYTDKIGANNSANVPFLSMYISGEGSNVGFVDTITVNSGGTSYNNSDVVVFTGGAPTTTAVATVNTYSNGTIQSLTVTTPGTGYNSRPAISITTSGGSGANLTAVMDYGYGFSKLPDADLSSIISLALSRGSLTIGTISALTALDPGANNNASPFNLVIEPSIAGYGRRNFILNLNNVTQDFVVGEEITQQFTEPSVTIPVTNAGVFTLRETVKQQRADGNTVYGEVYSANITANSGTIVLKVANTANTFNTSNNMVGLESGATANLTAVYANTILSTGKGEILTTTGLSANSLTLTVKRKKFATSFTSNVAITGSDSGASGNVVSVLDLAGSPIMGNNALVTSIAGSANGSITSVEIIDSGFTYRENEELTLTNEDNQYVATGRARIVQQGIGEGYWQTTDSFISSDKYIHDSNYYQEYSFEIQTGITLDKYASILKELVQVAGTKLFGTVVRVSSANTPVTSSSSITVE